MTEGEKDRKRWKGGKKNPQKSQTHKKGETKTVKTLQSASEFARSLAFLVL